MSGVNWVPAWALGGSDGDHRFRVVSRRQGNARAGLRNWYTDPVVARPRPCCRGSGRRALAGHEALWAWDLGNENSNCVVPPTRSSARNWLARITTAIRTRRRDGADHGRLAHGRPGGGSTARAARGLRSRAISSRCTATRSTPIGRTVRPTSSCCPFLAHVTRWLGEGRDVLFTEFGLPTYRAAIERRSRLAAKLLPTRRRARLRPRTRARGSALSARRLLSARCSGATRDYDPALWENRRSIWPSTSASFGLWRVDGSPKPSVAAVAAFAGAVRTVQPRTTLSWIDIDPDEFFSTRRCSSPASTVGIGESRRLVSRSLRSRCSEHGVEQVVELVRWRGRSSCRRRRSRAGPRPLTSSWTKAAREDDVRDVAGPFVRRARARGSSWAVVAGRGSALRGRAVRDPTR